MTEITPDKMSDDLRAIRDLNYEIEKIRLEKKRLTLQQKNLELQKEKIEKSVTSVLIEQNQQGVIVDNVTFLVKVCKKTKLKPKEVREKEALSILNMNISENIKSDELLEKVSNALKLKNTTQVPTLKMLKK
jgi:hypothetical protein